MFNKIDLFAKTSLMAKHAVERQRLIADNIANANTPGFKARDLQPFSEFLEAAGSSQRTDFPIQTVYRPNGAEPNGNTVSIENEIMASAEAAGQHETALLLYRKSMDLLRASLRAR